MRRFPILRAVALVAASLTAPALPVGAALPASAAVKEGDEIRVPPEYAHEKIKRFVASVPPGKYRVSVDVPPGKGSTSHIAHSSGSKPVDAVALDFADAYVGQVKRLREMHRTQELRFPFVFDLSKPPGVWQTTVPAWAIRAPLRGKFGQGTLLVRVASDPNGRLKSANMVVSTGSRAADMAIEAYALQHWTGPSNEASIVRAEFKLGR